MTQGPTIMAVSRETLNWVQQGGRPTRVGLGKRILLSWLSFWFERNLATQRRLQTPADLDPAPVFILGPWRSGTTFLHELLAAYPGACVPTTWQCMNASVFGISAPPRATASLVRPMDGALVDAFSPQEDEFALLALGVPSVYRGFLDPRRLPELARWLKQDNWTRENPLGWVRLWKEFLRGVAGNRGGRMYIKSPNHTFRIPALLDLFPKAAYVWVARDPTEVFYSNRKMWLSMFDRYALWEWDLQLLDSFLAEAFASCARSLDIARDTLPQHRFAVVDFATLTSRPIQAARLLNDRLALGSWEIVEPAIERAVSLKTSYGRSPKVPSPTHDLSEASQSAAAKLGDAQSRALRSHGIGC